jgi:hypothetical protein
VPLLGRAEKAQLEELILAKLTAYYDAQRTLFTALCYLTAGAPAMPRDSLQALATEATSSLAAQINRLGTD